MHEILMQPFLCVREMVNMLKCTMAYRDRPELINYRCQPNTHLDLQPLIPLVKGNTAF